MVYAVIVCLSVYVSVCVCLSIILWYCIKTAKHRMTQIMPHDSPADSSLLIMAKFERDHPLPG